MMLKLRWMWLRLLHPHEGDRASIARTTTNPTTLDALSLDPDWWVVQCVAYNPHTPPSALERLATYPLDIVRKNVLIHPLTPEHVRMCLYDDTGQYVRLTAAWWPMTPLDVLIRYTHDIDEDVRAVAWETIEKRGVIELLGDEG